MIHSPASVEALSHDIELVETEEFRKSSLCESNAVGSSWNRAVALISADYAARKIELLLSLEFDSKLNGEGKEDAIQWAKEWLGLDHALPLVELKKMSTGSTPDMGLAESRELTQWLEEWSGLDSHQCDSALDLVANGKGEHLPGAQLAFALGEKIKVLQRRIARSRSISILKLLGVGEHAHACQGETCNVDFGDTRHYFTPDFEVYPSSNDIQFGTTLSHLEAESIDVLARRMFAASQISEDTYRVVTLLDKCESDQQSQLTLLREVMADAEKRTVIDGDLRAAEIIVGVDLGPIYFQFYEAGISGALVSLAMLLFRDSDPQGAVDWVGLAANQSGFESLQIFLLATYYLREDYDKVTAVPEQNFGIESGARRAARFVKAKAMFALDDFSKAAELLELVKDSFSRDEDMLGREAVHELLAECYFRLGAVATDEQLKFASNEGTPEIRREALELQALRLGLGTRPAGIKAQKRERPSRELRRLVYDRDGGRCAECGSGFDLQYDHIIPVIKGGSTTFENLQVLCGECNRRKGAEI